jgi:hypothetical protein
MPASTSEDLVIYAERDVLHPHSIRVTVLRINPEEEEGGE